MVELRSDIFIIPTSSDNSIIYSPLRGAAFFANPEATSVIQEYIQSGCFPERSKGTTLQNYLFQLAEMVVEQPKNEDLFTDSSSAIFILSQICNLECTYCYAQNSRSKEILSKEKIKSVIDSVCLKTTPKNKSFSFIGGGEPLATWDVFKWSVSYIKSETKKRGLSNRIGLTTNGTLLNEERVLFLKENKVVVSVSFDILPEIQNTQRPFPHGKNNSFEKVHNNIKLLLTNGVTPRIRSTVTRKNLDLMPQMIEFVLANYPEIKLLHFEPVTDVNENSEEFFRTYLLSFSKAKRISHEHGLSLKNSITNSFSRLRTRFCNGEFCVTPTSDIVSCHRVSSDREEFFESFRYGKVTNNGIDIDATSIQSVLEISDKKIENCSTCFAKWHCAGGCPMYRVVSTEKEFSSYCSFVRDTISATLEEKLGNSKS